MTEPTSAELLHISDGSNDPADALKTARRLVREGRDVFAAGDYALQKGVGLEKLLANVPSYAKALCLEYGNLGVRSTTGYQSKDDMRTKMFDVLESVDIVCAREVALQIKTRNCKENCLVEVVKKVARTNWEAALALAKEIGSTKKSHSRARAIQKIVEEVGAVEVSRAFEIAEHIAIKKTRQWALKGAIVKLAESDFDAALGKMDMLTGAYKRLGYEEIAERGRATIDELVEVAQDQTQATQDGMFEAIGLRFYTSRTSQALDFAARISDPKKRNKTIYEIINKLEFEDVAQIIKLADKYMLDENEKRQLVLESGARGSYEKALEVESDIQKNWPARKSEWVDELWTAFLKNHDCEISIYDKVVRRMSPGSERCVAYEIAGNRIAQKNVPAAVEFAENAAGPTEQNATYMGIAGAITKTNPSYALLLLNGLPQNQRTAYLTKKSVEELAKENPWIAMRFAKKSDFQREVGFSKVVGELAYIDIDAAITQLEQMVDDAEKKSGLEQVGVRLLNAGKRTDLQRIIDGPGKKYVPAICEALLDELYRCLG